jgi:hypothetical protein
VGFNVEEKPLHCEVAGWVFEKSSTFCFNERPVRYIGRSIILPTDSSFTRILAMGYKSYRSSKDSALLYDNLLNSL